MTNERKQRLLCFIADDDGKYYYDGPLDGIWGPESQKAAERFLKDFSGDSAGDNNVGDSAAAEDSTETDSFWADVYPIFTREEFRCKCGGKYCDGFPAEPKETLVRKAYQLRMNLGVPVTVVSGLRCETWNRIQGGVEFSQHCDGSAMDIWAQGKTQAQVEAELDRIGGIRYHYAIAGSSNVHFDVPRESR